MSWERVEGKARAILETLRELQELGVRGPLGIPLDYAIRKSEEDLEDIRRRLGKPEAWEETLRSKARMVYDLAHAYSEDLILRSKMREWGLTCASSCAFDTRREVLTCSLEELREGKLVRAGSFDVPCSREEFEHTPEACNLRAIEENARRGCVQVARAVPPFYADLALNPRTMEVVNLTAEADRLLRNLKERLQV
jgi:hypothetical protein